MADRIFINKDSERYSKQELNCINWDNVKAGMKEAHKAIQAGKTLNQFGIVTGLLNSRTAQFSSGMDEGMGEDLGHPMGSEMDGDSARLDSIAAAITNGEEIDQEDAQFGLDNVEAIANSSGMSPEEVHSALQDYVGLNVEGNMDGGEDFGDGSMGDGMESAGLNAFAGRKLPAALEQFKFKKPGSEDGKGSAGKTEDEEEEDDDSGEAETKGRKANKFVFTDPSQLSAAALEAAKQSGNEALVRATLAARKERRMAVGKKVAAETLEQITREAKSKRRQTTAKKAAPKTEVTANVKNDNNAKVDFVNPTQLDSNQKSVFASKARELGFPEPYIQHFLGVKTASVTEASVKQIAEGEGTFAQKATRIASMIREAKLDDSNRNRILDYWVEELGYPRDYVQKLVEDYKG